MPDRIRLDGKIAVVTGAAGVIGRATTELLAERGARIVAVDRKREDLEDAIKGLPASAEPLAVTADVSDEDEVADYVRAAVDRFGTIDVFYNNAGVEGEVRPITQYPLETFRRVLDVNVVGVAHAIEAVLPGMIARGRGHLVGLASVAGYRGFPWMISYSASKAALIAYLEALRPGLPRRGVTVTTVCPGFVRTQMCTSVPYQRPVKMIEPEEAARHLVRAVEKRPRNCIFPWSMRISLAILKYMPDRLFDRLMQWIGPKALHVEF